MPVRRVPGSTLDARWQFRPSKRLTSVPGDWTDQPQWLAPIPQIRVLSLVARYQVLVEEHPRACTKTMAQDQESKPSRALGSVMYVKRRLSKRRCDRSRYTIATASSSDPPALSVYDSIPTFSVMFCVNQGPRTKDRAN